MILAPVKVASFCIPTVCCARPPPYPVFPYGLSLTAVGLMISSTRSLRLFLRSSGKNLKEVGSVRSIIIETSSGERLAVGLPSAIALTTLSRIEPIVFSNCLVTAAV